MYYIHTYIRTYLLTLKSKGKVQYLL